MSKKIKYNINKKNNSSITILEVKQSKGEKREHHEFSLRRWTDPSIYGI